MSADTLLWIGLGAALVFGISLVYAMCVVAGDADERAGLK